MQNILPRKRSTNRFGTALVVASALCSILLSGCASQPDPETTVDSLREVTEPATPSEGEKETDESDEQVGTVEAYEPLDCTPYFVITARGTGEPTKGQLLSPVARSISEARPEDVTVLDLDYPADTEVNAGAAAGVTRLVEMLNAQSEACPRQKFVLLGYSQGALIVSDALSAPELRVVGEDAGELTAEAAERIAAIVLYGDPRFVGKESFNFGSYNSNLNGILAREPGTLDEYGDRTRDYCVRKDFVCQITTDLTEDGHVEYFENGMQQDGAAFVITKLDPVR